MAPRATSFIDEGEGGQGAAAAGQRLGYPFRGAARLESALTHKSYLNENPGAGRPDNERLEFLGDAVLGLAVGHLLMERFPALHEGELSMMRAQIVNEQHLAEVAAALGLGEWLFLGRGGGGGGAACRGGGFDAACAVVRHLFGPRLDTVQAPGVTDFKTRLQER